MKYTTYYSALLKAKGIPHLTVSQQQDIMNIVFLEGGLYHLDKLKCDADTQANKSHAVYNLSAKLYNLTKNKAPEVLFKDILNVLD